MPLEHKKLILLQLNFLLALVPLICGGLLLVVNNGIILEFGKLTNKITLPLAYTNFYFIATSNTLNRTDGALCTYNDISTWAGAIIQKDLSSFSSRGQGDFICIGY